MALRFLRANGDQLIYPHRSYLDGLTKLTVAACYMTNSGVDNYDHLITHLNGDPYDKGFAIQHFSAGQTSAYVSCRNGSGTSKNVFGAFPSSTHTWGTFWMAYDGSGVQIPTQLLWWGNGTAASVDTPTLGSNLNTHTADMGIVNGTMNSTWAGLAFFPGVAITDTDLIDAHAALTGPLPQLPECASYLSSLTHYAEWESSYVFDIGGDTPSAVNGSPTFLTHPYTVPPTGSPYFHRDRARGPYAQLLRR